MCLGVLAEVIEIGERDDVLKEGKVALSGVKRDIYLGLVPDVSVGDFVLIHAGVALKRLTTREATAIINQIDEMQTNFSQGESEPLSD